MSTASGRVQPAQKKLKTLVLGGTGFIGPHQVQYAVDRGHAGTLFNRGRTNAEDALVAWRASGQQ